MVGVGVGSWRRAWGGQEFFSCRVFMIHENGAWVDVDEMNSSYALGWKLDEPPTI